jgi:hypothetical protein
MNQSTKSFEKLAINTNQLTSSKATANNNHLDLELDFSATSLDISKQTTKREKNAMKMKSKVNCSSENQFASSLNDVTETKVQRNINQSTEKGKEKSQTSLQSSKT